MKNIIAHVMAVFAAVLLITALSIPAFAATSYIFEGTSDGYVVADFLLPEGTYNVEIRSEVDGMSISSVSPVSISYSSDSDFTYFFNGPVSFTFDGVSETCILVIGANDNSSVTYFVGFSDNQFLLYEGVSLVFTPCSAVPSLSNYITAEALPNVFSEVISLLPLALGVIVGYLAIRKGIAFLQNIIHAA